MFVVKYLTVGVASLIELQSLTTCFLCSHGYSVVEECSRVCTHRYVAVFDWKREENYVFVSQLVLRQRMSVTLNFSHQSNGEM